ncbi:helix-hairpin-helix domain-containing protein [Streptomyces sp. NP160]|uniref:helix-hairpin-helix domain-containing protein n=1 Tax=Streptomyces sp. NP160 TaxID=2586637 RepID=UPI00214AC0E9|nr:helix-hairpin-helix domain-containing protein [Streptomyces sp. NP160]
MLEGAPGSGWQEDADGGLPARSAAAPGPGPVLRDRASLRSAARRDARETEQLWRPSLAERLREARWSLAPPAAVGALLVVAAVVVLLVLSAAAPGGASVPTPTPGVAVPARTPAALASSSSASESPLPGPSTSGTGEVVVDVVGQVEVPGLVRLPAGSRADDAVRAAGGARPGADLRRVNLARPLVDGEQLVVPAPGEQLPSAPPAPPAARSTSTAGGAAAGGGAAAATGPVDLNSATLAELDALPGVGPVLAQRILDWRDEHGRFTSVEELGEVPGFGPAALGRLTPLLVV